jgi:hypothetical protein
MGEINGEKRLGSGDTGVRSVGNGEIGLRTGESSVTSEGRGEIGLSIVGIGEISVGKGEIGENIDGGPTIVGRGEGGIGILPLMTLPPDWSISELIVTTVE